MTKLTKIVLMSGCLAIGLVSGYFIAQNNLKDSTTNEKDKPIYWVAPMDPTFKRDQPGKSPMGMDLVPVFKKDESDDNTGNVSVSANIIQSMGVKTERVAYDYLHWQYRAMAITNYNPAKVATITTRTKGWITSLSAKQPGQKINQDEQLFTYYSPDLVRAQEEYLVALKRNNDQMINAVTQKLTSLGINKAQITLIEKAGNPIQDIPVFAPMDGTVTNLAKSQGSAVQANEPVLQLYNMNSLWVDLALPQRLAPDIKQIDTVKFKPTNTELEIPVTLELIATQTDENSGALILRFSMDNQYAKLPVGFYGEATIEFTAPEKSILAPLSSVINTGKQQRVLVKLEKGVFKSVEVETGKQSSSMIEIKSGLAEGDQVVTNGQFLIDSESSKTSDFMRFAQVSETEKPTKIWMQGEINHLMLSSGMINISHAPAPAWDWPEMTMHFTLSEELDTSGLKAGQEIHFLVRDDDGDFVVETIHIMSSEQTSMEDEASNADKTNNHQHHEMDH